MTMDHRCGARARLDLRVAICSRTSGDVPGRVRDISIGGMRIDTEGEFAVYQPVAIEFSFPSESPPQRWQAMVVHTANGSIGVMFKFLQTTDLATLLGLLRAADAYSSTLAADPPARSGPRERRNGTRADRAIKSIRSSW